MASNKRALAWKRRTPEALLEKLSVSLHQTLNEAIDFFEGRSVESKQQISAKLYRIEEVIDAIDPNGDNASLQLALQYITQSNDTIKTLAIQSNNVNRVNRLIGPQTQRPLQSSIVALDSDNDSIVLNAPRVRRDGE